MNCRSVRINHLVVLAMAVTNGTEQKQGFRILTIIRTKKRNVTVLKIFPTLTSKKAVCPATNQTITPSFFCTYNSRINTVFDLTKMCSSRSETMTDQVTYPLTFITVSWYSKMIGKRASFTTTIRYLQLLMQNEGVLLPPNTQIK